MLFNFHNVMDSFEDIKIAVAGTGYVGLSIADRKSVV